MRSNIQRCMLSLFILVSFVLSLVYAAGDPALIAKRCLLPEADEPAPICGGGPRPTQTASSASTVQSYTVNDPEKYPNEISVKITVPNELDDKAYNAALLDNLKSNLPNTLQQLQVDPAQIPALAEEGLPLLLEAITAVQNGSSLSDDPGSETARARRGLFSKIGKWIKKVVSAIVKAVQEAIKDLECSAFAALTLPGFMVSDAAFTILNIGGTGVPTTKDQDYFIDPLHGSVSHDDGVSIYYNARFAPGFGSAAATTFGRRIYMRADNSATIASPPLVQQSGFQQRTKTLLHEFTHVKQYKALFYDESSFGLRYLFAYCKAGYSYDSDALEVEAYDKQEQVNALLQDYIGAQFFDKWKSSNLAPSVGLPAKTKYNQDAPSRYSLPFQQGTVTLTCNSVNQCV